MDLIVDIVAYLVSKIDAKVPFSSVEAIDGGFRYHTNKTKWAQKQYKVNGGHEILNVKRNCYIDLAVEVEVIELKKPLYFHGTFIEGSIEISDYSNDLIEKTPLIYLREELNETRQLAESNRLVRQQANVQLFCLTGANHTDWQVKDAYDEAIYPMLALWNEFEQVMLKDRCLVQPPATVDLIGKTKFAVVNREKQIFKDPLAGVECNFMLNVKGTISNCIINQ